MGYPGYPPARPTKPPVSSADLSISIAALVLTILMGVAAAFLGVFSLAFLDYCPPETCSTDRAMSAVATALLIAAVIGVAGLAVTIAQLVRRKTAWPYAVGTQVLCTVVCFFGGVGYVAAVGA
jgi:lysylphosphatidylglycerol synthetase-like protein (DUF2156 family)